MSARERDTWDRFLRYAAHLRGKPSFDQEDREYRLQIAERLRGMLISVREGFITPSMALETLFVGSFLGQPYFLTMPPHNEALERWAAIDEPSLTEALYAFTEDRAPEERFDRFVELARSVDSDEMNELRPRLALPFGSLFNFAVDPQSLPVVLPGLFNVLIELLGDGPPRGDANAKYRGYLQFAREVRAAMEEYGIPIRDMVDVQSLLQLAFDQRDVWTGQHEIPTIRTRSSPRREGEQKPHYLSMCAIYRDEAPYLAEWIEFHRQVGFERFFLYDNLSSDGHREVLEPYVREGIVVPHEWPVFPAGQPPAYDHCLENHGDESRWIAFVDVDEFLFSPTGEGLPDVLEAYEDFPGIGVGIALFGSSGHRTRPQGLVIENYTRRFDLQGIKAIKSVVDPARTLRCGGAHTFVYDGLPTFDENGYAIGGAKTKWVSVDRLRINHYWMKSEQEFRAKCSRPMPSDGKLRPWPDLLANSWMCSETDTEVFRHVPGVRKALERHHTPAPVAPG